MTATALVPVFTGTIADRAFQLCDARTLHSFMQVKRDFTTWIKGRIQKFGFVVGEDFVIVENLSSPNLVSAKARAQKLSDYYLTLDMAKELAMVENNEQGRAARHNPQEAYHAMCFAGPELTRYLNRGHPDGFFHRMAQWALAAILANPAQTKPLLPVKALSLGIAPREGMDFYLAQAATAV